MQKVNKRQSEGSLNKMQDWLGTLNVNFTGQAYMQLYAALQQLHMQGEYAAVIGTCSVLTLIKTLEAQMQEL